MSIYIYGFLLEAICRMAVPSLRLGEKASWHDLQFEGNLTRAFVLAGLNGQLHWVQRGNK
eukprot:3810800-Amphidinium_carterae.1